MVKSTVKLAKLTIRRETIRALSRLELAGAAAGDGPKVQAIGTEGPATGCPLVAALVQKP
ncbi:MAG TPA: hypothetical protein VFP84_06625 [Kofleriaceae bacterium]|nr:hypothetical protein [Kofleriaceae bacterium]